MTEPTDSSVRRRKRQTEVNTSSVEDDDLFEFDFNDFESNFDESSTSPSVDSDFEPSIDLPLGIFLKCLGQID